MDNSARREPDGDADSYETVSMVLRHITAIPSGTALPKSLSERPKVQEVAMEWQQLGMHAEWAELHGARNGAVEGRMSELIGRAAVTGEQLGLAWTLDQELQRWHVSDEAQSRPGHSMATRALAEMCGYYLLAAAHALGNLTLRTLAISAAAGSALDVSYANCRRFPPFSNEKSAWPPLNPRLASAVVKAARFADVGSAIRMTEILGKLVSDHKWVALVDRRDADYHRWRPQGLPGGGVPQTSRWQDPAPGTRSLSGGGKFLVPVDNQKLCSVPGEALEVLGKAMEAWLHIWPVVLSEFGVPVFKITVDDDSG